MSGPAQGFSIDLSNYKDRSSAHLPEGEYLVRVTDGEVGAIKSGDNAGLPIVTLWYEVVGGPANGQVLVDRLPITDNAKWKVVQFLRAVNHPTPKRQLQIQFKAIVGRTLIVKVEDGEPYNGNVKSEIRSYQSAGAPAASTAPEPAPVMEADAEVGVPEVAPMNPAQPQQTFVATSIPDEAADESAIDSWDGTGIDLDDKVSL